MFVAVYSNIQKLPTCQVFRISHTDWTVEGVTLTPVGYLLEPSSKFMVHLSPDYPTFSYPTFHFIRHGHMTCCLPFLCCMHMHKYLLERPKNHELSKT
jgi:hypothetical protein